MVELECVRCGKKLIGIGFVVLMTSTGITRRVNVCNKHIEQIEQWLNLSVHPNMKLPKLPKSLDQSIQLSLYTRTGE